MLRIVGNCPFEDTRLVGDVLMTPVEELWENMPLKLWHAARWLLEQENVEGVLKMDDDVEIESPDDAWASFEELFKHPYASFQIGSMKKGDKITYAQTRVPKTSRWSSRAYVVPESVSYASGSCMWLSTQALEKLAKLDTLSRLAQTPLEDVFIGTELQRQHISVTKCPTKSVTWRRLDKTLGDSESSLRQQSSPTTHPFVFDAVCVWGWPLHSHTHSYIHNGFFLAAKHLGLQTEWVDNVKGAADRMPPKTLFITETQVDSNIPLRKDCFYVLHNCDKDKYKDVPSVFIQCFLPKTPWGDVFLEKPWLRALDRTLYMPWATDLLPHEITRNMDTLEIIASKRKEDVHAVAYIVEDPWFIAERHLSTRGIKFVKAGGYGLENVSVEENERRMQESIIAPALQSSVQIGYSYLPCRILKNISYGCLGITNNPHTVVLFGKELFEECIVLGDTVEDALDKGLAASMDFASQRRIMRFIRDNHTYVNRLQELDAMFRRFI